MVFSAIAPFDRNTDFPLLGVTGFKVKRIAKKRIGKKRIELITRKSNPVAFVVCAPHTHSPNMPQELRKLHRDTRYH